MPTNEEINEKIRELSDTLQNTESTQPIIDQVTANPFPLDRARFHLTQIVLWSFLMFLVVIILTVEANYDAPRTRLLIDVCKTMLLPLVTLMIGHYFGASRSAE
jgi:hypothetical protein